MSDLRPVRPASLLDRHRVATAVLVGVGLFVVVAKPWGPPGSSTVLPSAAPTPKPIPTAASILDPSVVTIGAPRPYDRDQFWQLEPAPSWQLWPASHLVSFWATGPIALPSTPVTLAPAARPMPSARPSDQSPPLDVGSSDHLYFVGVNVPLDVDVRAISLSRIIGGAFEPVPTATLDSPWPAHFHVIAIPTGSDADLYVPWPIGLYRLDLTIGNGDGTRTIPLVVDGTGGSG